MINQTFSSEELELLAAGYVLNDLDETEQALVAELIETNAAMREQIRQSIAVMGILATNLPQKSPPQSLKTKITQVFETEFSGQKKTNLDNWFQEIFEAGWQTAAELLGNQTLSPAFRSVGVARAKTITIQPDNPISIILMLKITKTSLSQRNVILEILPSDRQEYLPNKLGISILDENGNQVIEETTDENSKNIKFQFSGLSRDSFSLKFVLANDFVLEDFLL